jgi:general secretion pathway protein G
MFNSFYVFFNRQASVNKETHQPQATNSEPQTLNGNPQSAIRNPQSTQRGFTLIEIMVVVVIMGILAALIVPKLMGRTDDARLMAAKQDIATLMQALKLYKLDNQRYPSTEQGLQALVAKPVNGPAAPNWKTGGYLDKLPKDPWGGQYQFLSPGLKGEVDVLSFGADGQAGGTGSDADIGSWEL